MATFGSLVCEVTSLPAKEWLAFELEEKHYKRDLALLDSYLRYAGSSEDSSSSGSGLILF